MFFFLFCGLHVDIQDLFAAVVFCHALCADPELFFGRIAGVIVKGVQELFDPDLAHIHAAAVAQLIQHDAESGVACGHAEGRGRRGQNVFGFLFFDSLIAVCRGEFPAQHDLLFVRFGICHPPATGCRRFYQHAIHFTAQFLKWGVGTAERAGQTFSRIAAGGELV